ncbi:hypothetical protein BGAL_0005g00520 [Botrytis galanthina]|uniref:Uncharacterized protein n=1 Tax=Botrytis galanthina TaxID=278940 RepID=A0A4S8RBX7_9HELO|nr:hypothetical protein BGAL_0005g00520 [Botrytis galanthina]
MDTKQTPPAQLQSIHSKFTAKQTNKPKTTNSRTPRIPQKPAPGRTQEKKVEMPPYFQVPLSSSGSWYDDDDDDWSDMIDTIDTHEKWSSGLGVKGVYM